jgi:HD-like signal output (HDOD) protein
MSAGMNHAEIGALIAEKWNFPTPLVQAIRYHHDPDSAPDEAKSMVESVYLANMFCEYEAENIGYEQIQPDVMSKFGITNQQQMNGVLKQVRQVFLKAR